MPQWVKNLPAVWDTQVRSLGLEDSLEKGMATHSDILAWRIPWTEESGGLYSSWTWKELDMTERLTVWLSRPGQIQGKEWQESVVIFNLPQVTVRVLSKASPKLRCSLWCSQNQTKKGMTFSLVSHCHLILSLFPTWNSSLVLPVMMSTSLGYSPSSVSLAFGISSINFADVVTFSFRGLPSAFC